VGGIPPTSPVWSRDAPVAANAPRSDKPPTVPESSCWPNLPGPQPTGHQLAGRKVLQIGSSVAMGKKQSLQSLEYDFYKGRSPVTGVSPTSHFTGWDIYIGTGTLLPFQCNPNPVTPRYISAPGGPPKPPTVPNHHVPPYPRPNPTPSQPHPARSRRAQVPRPPTVPHATNGGGLGAHPLPHPTMGAALGAPTGARTKRSAKSRDFLDMWEGRWAASHPYPRWSHVTCQAPAMHPVPISHQLSTAHRSQLTAPKSASHQLSRGGGLNPPQGAATKARLAQILIPSPFAAAAPGGHPPAPPARTPLPLPFPIDPGHRRSPGS
jgi:hypothetical protein